MTSHGWYLLAPFRWDGTILERTEYLDGAVDLRIRSDDSCLIVEPDRADLAPRLRRMFQLDVDTSEFLSLCRKSDSHRAIARTRFGRLLCGSTVWEDAVKIIATTNTTWRQTVRMVDLLVEHFGIASASGHRAFPEPRDIASASIDDLKQKCRLGYRATYIRALARGIVDGSIDLDAMRDPTLSSEELLKSYRRLPGIGPYGAAHLLAMEGRHDFIAVDTEFRSFVRARYHQGRTVKDTTLLRHYSRWGKWKYLAYWSELWEAYLKERV